MNQPYHVRLAIGKYGDETRVELFTEDLGESAGDRLASGLLSEGTTLDQLARGASLVTPDKAREAGRELHRALLGRSRNSRKWAEVLNQVGRQRRLLRLLVDAPYEPARDLPFGLLCDPGRDAYLLRPNPGDPPTQIIRIVGRCTPKTSRVLEKVIRGEPIRILVAVAESIPPHPEVSAPALLDLMGDLAAALHQTEGRYEVFFVGAEGAVPLASVTDQPVENWTPEPFQPLCKADRNGLQRAIVEGGFDVVHLLVHGERDYIILCDPQEERVALSGGELAEWCREGQVDLAFLQFVETNLEQEPGQFAGFAQLLLDPRGGDLAAVVQASCPLPGVSSVEMAVEFYRAVANGLPYEEALNREVLSENDLTWALLELWIRPGVLRDVSPRGLYLFDSPYRGLASFGERDAAEFQGRDAETAELLAILENEPVLAVSGDPGVGKSSLLRAGLAHTVRHSGLAGVFNWRVVTLKPGAHPARTLMASLLGDDQELASVEDLPAYNDWLPPLRELLTASCNVGRPLLLIFDQFEEMFTLERDLARRDALAIALGEAAMKYPETLRVVLGLRGEFLGAAATLPGLGGFLQRPYILRPPGQEELRAIITEPAESHGYEFEGPLDDGRPEHAVGLVDRLLADPTLAVLRAPVRVGGGGEASWGGGSPSDPSDFSRWNRSHSGALESGTGSTDSEVAIPSLAARAGLDPALGIAGSSAEVATGSLDSSSPSLNGRNAGGLANGTNGSGRLLSPGSTSTPLPLLSFALERLWSQAVARGSNRFTHADYDTMGGLSGALAGHADEVVESIAQDPEFGPDAVDLVRRVFLMLVTQRRTRRPRLRADLEAAFEEPDRARAIVDRLVSERLLTLRTEPDDPTLTWIDLAHEALIESWDQLRDWLSPATSTEARGVTPALSSAAVAGRLATAGQKTARGGKGFPAMAAATGLTMPGSEVDSQRQALAELMNRSAGRSASPTGGGRLPLILGAVAAVFALVAVWLGWNGASLRGQLNEAKARVTQLENELNGTVEEREQARQALEVARQATSQATSSTPTPPPGVPETVLSRVRSELNQTRAYLEAQLTRQAWNRAASAWRSGDFAGFRTALAKARDLSGDADLGLENGLLTWLAQVPVRFVEPIADAGGTGAAATTLFDVSADGKVALTRSDQPTALLLFVDGQAAAKRLEGLTAPATALAVSADGRVAAAGAADGTVRLWRTDNGQPLAANNMLNQGAVVKAVGLAPGGDRVVAIGGDAVNVWNVADGKPAWSIKLNAEVLTVASSAVVVGDARGVVAALDLTTGKTLKAIYARRSKAPVVALASANGTPLVAIATNDRFVSFHKLPNLEQTGGYASSPGAPFQRIALGANGRVLAGIAGDGVARVWSLADPAKPVEIQTYRGVGAGPVAVALSAAPGGGAAPWVWLAGPDGSVLAFDASRSAEALAVTPNPVGLVQTVWFAPDHAAFLLDDGSASLAIYRAADGQALGKLNRTGLPLALGPAGRLVVLAEPDGTTRLKSPEGANSSQGVEVVLEPPHSGGATAATFSGNGRNLATGGGLEDRRVRLRDATNGRARAESDDLGGAVTALAWSHDDARLAVGVRSEQGKVRALLLDGQTARTLQTVETGSSSPIVALAVGPSLWTVAHDDFAIELFNPTDATPRLGPGDTAGPWRAGGGSSGGPGGRLALSQRGDRLVVASGNVVELVALGGPDGGGPLLSLPIPGRADSVATLGLAGDGSSLVVVGSDRKVFLRPAAKPR